MNIGQLKHRISLVEEVETKDADGFKKKSWIEIRKSWCAITTYKRSKIVENDKESEEVTILFTVRYQDITKNHRIRYQGKDYRIESILDKNFSKRFLELSVKEVN